MPEIKLENKKIIDLLSDVHKGIIQLPNFQRDFKWKSNEVLKLLDSICQNHPAGSLLFLELDPKKNDQIISAEKIRTVPDNIPLQKPKYLILDGQQRITSCYNAMTNYGLKNNYFIDLKKLMDYIESSEQLDLIDNEILVSKESSNKNTPTALLHSNNLLPFSYLLNTDDSSQSRRCLRKELGNYEKVLQNEDENNKLLNFLWTEFGSFFDILYDYKFPIIILPKELELSAVCKVFQTINTTGLKLSAFDICVATFMPHNINLKNKLDESKEGYSKIIPILENDDCIILQIIALLAGKATKKNKLPDNLTPENIREFWKVSEEYLNECVEMLDRFGVALSKDLKLLPYKPIIPVIAAILSDVNYKDCDQIKKSNIETKLKIWFYTIGLIERYAQGTDNKMKEDYVLLTHWLNNNRKPDYITQGLNYNIEEIIKTKASTAFGKTILVTLNSNNPIDFYLDNVTGYGNNIAVDCQLHHIFPKAEYGDENINKINSVFNFAIITTDSNQYIKDKKTLEYINGILSNTGISNEVLKLKLKTHFIEEDAYNYLYNENYNDFLKKRADNILNFLAKNGIKINKIEQTSEKSEDDIDDYDE